jgi:hypothetical protein
MVVDIINKTLDTTAIVKIPILTSPIEPYCILILMVTFTKNWELALFFGKVDQLGTQIFLPLELNKSLKTVQFNQLLARKTKHFLPLMRPSSSWWNNFYTYTFFLDSSSL